MPNKTIRRSVSMTPAMAQRLKQIADSRPRNVSESDIIREALRRYLDEQEDLIGSRRHFQRTFRDRLDTLEETLNFQLTVLTYLLTSDDDKLHEAIINAKRHGETLHAQLQAVREWKDDQR